MKIAIDAMGGDYAPKAIIDGVKIALEDFPEINKIFLVGHTDILNKYLNCISLNNHPKIEIVHAEQILLMEDSPTEAFRAKKDSSISIASKIVSEGKADALLGAGNTGAVSSCGILNIGLIEGIKRPAIVTLLPTESKKPCLVLDAGATVDCSPEILLQFAMMANIYSQDILKQARPNIGLLNIGSENSKGNTLVKATFKLLEEQAQKQKNFNFKGNIEGYNIFSSDIDIVVTDGFTGNILLKVSEGSAKFIVSSLKKIFFKSLRNKLGAFLLKKGFEEVKSVIDHKNYGGAPLLGVAKPVIIAHGNSDARAIYNALRVTIETLKHNLCAKIKDVAK